MARKKNYSLLLLNLIIILHASSSSSSAFHSPKSGLPPPGSDDPKATSMLFIFGDSFLDVGNNNYINTSTLDQANFWPYGETYFRYPTGRFSDGRVVPDFIAEKARLPLIPPYLQPRISHGFGVNFASAGAGALVETFQGSVIDLKTQLRNFNSVENSLRQKLGQRTAKIKLSKAVYILCIGSNDYMSPFLTNSTHVFDSYSTTTYVGMVIGNLTTVIKEIYAKGGRKFGFINLPPLGCLPGLRIIGKSNDTKCFEEPSSLAKLHNTALSNRLFTLEEELQGFRYSLYDFNTFLLRRINHPSKYGFIEGKGACCGSGTFRGVFSCGGKRIVKEYQLCGSPSQHIFWDSYHLTERAYQQLSIEMWGGEGNTYKLSPYSLKDLFLKI